MTTTPGHYDFTIYQGATFSRVLTWKDENGDAINLTGYSARLHIRESQDADDAFIALESGSGITLGGPSGTITLAIDADDTAAITQSAGVYDLELESAGGVVTRLLSGEVRISKEVTRD